MIIYQKVMEEQPPKASSTNTNYGQPSYWDVRYKKSKGQRFDWLQNYQTLQELIEKQLNYNKQSVILNIGCGNGQIQDSLYEAGYHNIVNNDISSVVIEDMIEIRDQKGYKSMIYEIMDVRNMKYSKQTYDMVLDKSTIDALLCSDTPLVSVAMMLHQVYRVLKDNGIYFMVSYGTPQNRMQHLEREHIKFKIDVIQLSRECEDNGGKLTHYIYICRKQPLKNFTKENYQHIIKKLKEAQQQYESAS